MTTGSIQGESFTPLKNKVLVSDLDHGVKLTSGGILLPDDNRKAEGIRSRWAKVHAIGPEVDDLSVGEWVLIEHGRWTNGFDLEIGGETTRVWHIDYPAAVLLVSPDDPRTDRTVSL